jgi:hypothetical protein
MQDIYKYIPEKNYVSREYSVAAILLLLLMVHILLLLLLLLLLTASGYVPGDNGTTIHKITHTDTQNNTQHTKLQTQ